MSIDQTHPPKTTDTLRQEAEAEAQSRIEVQSDIVPDAASSRLLHELQVHRIELEQQNEELVEARTTAELAAAHYTELYDFAPIGYLTLNRNGNITQANLASSRLLNRERTHLMGKYLGSFMSMASTLVFENFLERLFVACTKTACELELCIDGQKRTVLMDACVSTDQLECRASMIDITERKLAEASMRQLTHIVSSSTDMLALISKEYVYNAANSTYLNAYNVTSEQLIGKTVPEVVGEALFNTTMKPFADRCLAGETLNYLALLDFPAKPKRYMNITYSPYIDDENTVQGFVISERDITEQNKMETALFNAKKLESIGTLAGGIAHDFNNILAILFGNIELAAMKLPCDHAAYRYLETANQALDRATNLTKQLLTFSKGGDPIIETANINKVIQDSIRFNLSGSDIKVHMNLPDNLWPAKIDKGQISQVISNLAVNAKQAMPDGGSLYIDAENISDIRQHRTNDLSAVTLAGSHVKISIRDEGIGISNKDIETIFDPYFTTKQSGSGLGLAIVRSIIAKHHGHIGINSKPGVGTTFTLFFPAEMYPHTTSNAMPSDRVEKPDAVSGHVLVMDDDAEIRNMTAEMLQHCGYQTDCAVDGENALEKYISASNKDNHFDVVIMDLTIRGGMGGKKAIKELLAIDSNAKVIVASGYATDPIIANYGDYGFKGRLIKPFQLPNLKEELSRVMALT